MLTSKEKARVFAMYIGCEMIFEKSGRIETLHGVGQIENDFLLFGNNNSFHYSIYKFKLLLKPLSEITMKHVKEICKMLNVSIPDNATLTRHKGTEFYQPKRWARLSYIQQWGPDEGRMKVIMNIADDGISNYDGNHYFENHYRVADYLRENSYMLPYKNVDLFQSGIAINSSLSKGGDGEAQ